MKTLGVALGFVLMAHAAGAVLDGTHTVVCRWCTSELQGCDECLRSEAHPQGGCVFDNRSGGQSWGVAADSWCPPGTTPGTCQQMHFLNEITGHTVGVPMPSGYKDKPCSFEPPLPGSIPRPAAWRRAQELKT